MWLKEMRKCPRTATTWNMGMPFRRIEMNIKLRMYLKPGRTCPKCLDLMEQQPNGAWECLTCGYTTNY
jgi:ribosomal protein L37AE/L43A